MNKIQQLIQQYCPDGVEFISFEDLFELRNGYTPSKSKKEYWENGNIPWFRMEDIRANGRILSNSIQQISNEAIKGGKLFPANSIIIATSATIGEHAIITTEYLSNQRFTCFYPKKKYKERINMMFMYYYTFILGEWCRSNTNVSGFASVDMSRFRKFQIPIPPLPIQQEIVSILDTFTALDASLQAELEARRKQYEHYRDQLLSFEGKEVEWKTLGGICKYIVSGGTPSTNRRDYYGGDIPWLRTQEVDWNNINDTGVKITELGLSSSTAKWIKPNCVIVAMYGATAAKVAVNKIPLTTNQACCNLEINEEVANYRFVFHWICKEYENLKSLGEGVQSNINSQKIKNFPIPIPPLPIQHRIVSILDKFDTLVNTELPAEIAARRKQYEYYREKLLTFKPLKS
jgi:type I restriction enzyme S subunit